MASDVVRIALEPLEIQLAMIVEAEILATTRDLIQDQVDISYLPVFQRMPTFDDRFFGRFQHTIEPP